VRDLQSEIVLVAQRGLVFCHTPQQFRVRQRGLQERLPALWKLKQCDECCVAKGGMLV
jgi:hypothetical protein